MATKEHKAPVRKPRPASEMSPEPIRKGAEMEDLSIRYESDGSLGLTNTGNRPPDDWAADTGPTRAAETSSPAVWDPLQSQPVPPQADPEPVAGPATLEQCLIKELQDLYLAETEQQSVLRQLAGAVSAGELKSAFEVHLSETEQQVERLTQILELLGEEPGGSGVVPAPVKAMAIESHKMLASSQGLIRDLMMIAEAQIMEHTEIAGYGTARAIAHTLGRDQEAHLLQTTLVEEEQADQRLTRIALRLMKEAAASEVGAACEYSPDPR